MRKSPYRHHVKNHVRRNGKGTWKPVKDYDRGKGEKEERRRRRRVVGGSENPYHVNIYYVEEGPEIMDMEAKSGHEVVERSITDRETQDYPYKISFRRMKE